MSPKKPAEIYPFIIHFIFAVIISISFSLTAGIFISPKIPIFSNFESLFPVIEILMIYILVISGWVGYSRSLIKWPHTNTKSGTFRFTLDLGILFCYSSLISSINYSLIFRENFMNWIGFIFFLFIMWDIIKIIEYRKRPIMAISRSFWKTIIFSIIFIFIIPYGNNLLLDNQTGIINNEVIYGIKLIVVILSLITYRYWKWVIPPQSRLVEKSNKKSSS